MTLRDAHVAWAWVVVVGNAVVGLWALAAHQRPSLRRPALWWCTAAAEIAIFVEVALGIGLRNAEDVEPAEFHMFYGFVALVAVAILYAYRVQLEHRLHLLYGFGGLFLTGLGIRAMVLHT